MGAFALCCAPGVICAKVHETADGPVLALDLWARGGLYAREFFDGQGKRRVFFWPDGASTTKGLFKAAGCHTLAWASRADGKRMEAFFNIPRGITRGAEEMIFLAEHGRRGADGTFTASGAGNAGGYAPEELFSDKVRSMEGLQQRLTAAIEGVIGLRVRVKLVAPNTIQRSEGKARRVTDLRNQ